MRCSRAFHTSRGPLAHRLTQPTRHEPALSCALSCLCRDSLLNSLLNFLVNFSVSSLRRLMAVELAKLVEDMQKPVYSLWHTVRFRLRPTAYDAL